MSLAKAKTSVEEGPKPPKGGSWLTDSKTFDDYSEQIGIAFTGTPTVPGEAVFQWCMNHIDDDMLSREDRIKAIQFMCDFPLNETYAKEHLSFCKVDDSGGDMVSLVVLRQVNPSYDFGWFAGVGTKFRQFMLGMTKGKDGKIPKLFMDKQLSKPCHDMGKKGNQFNDNLHTWSRKYGPSEPHWYFNFVATDPSLQGKGYGSEIMKRACELADEQSVDCYLETAGEPHKRFYEKHGFELTGTEVLKSPFDEADTCDVYLMVRKHNT